MNAHQFGLIEMAFTAVVVLGFAGWQLWTVRDAGKPPKSADKAADDESAKRPGHPEG